MTQQIQLSDAAVLVNNVQIGTTANTITFNEGLGEQKMRAVSTGGGGVELIYSNDIESNIGQVKFEVPSTPKNIAKVRQWKTNLNQNVISLQGSTPDGETLTRTFTQAALVNDYEVNLGSETNIALEFMSNPTI